MSVSADRTGLVSASDAGSRRQRVDAQRNRERILAAARDLLGAPGELKLNAVARACGLGQGTLYRHFPTREDLLAAVYQREVDELVALAPQLLAARAPLSALGALSAWLERLVTYARVKRDVLAAVEAATGRDLTTHSLGPIGQALEALLAAGRTDGVIRPDVQARDVVILMSWLSRLDDDELDQRGQRLLAILLDGLRSPTETTDR